MSVFVHDRSVTSGRRTARRIAAILVTVLATLGLGVGAGLPAQAAGTGSITGMVTGPAVVPVTGKMLAVCTADGKYLLELTNPNSVPVSSKWSGFDDAVRNETVIPAGATVTEPTSLNQVFYETYVDGVQVNGSATKTDVSQVTCAPAVVFADIGPSAPFFSDIQWLAGHGITRGSVQPDGSVLFDPAGAVRREAMAAFLYRFAGSPAFTPPAASPFVDVATGDTFYKEIAWLAEQGISTGTDMGDGTFQFRPAESVSRDGTGTSH